MPFIISLSHWGFIAVPAAVGTKHWYWTGQHEFVSEI